MEFLMPKLQVKIDVSKLDLTQGSQIIETGDKILINNGFEEIEGEFIKQIGRSAFGSFGEYKTKDGQIHVYDETVHSIKKYG